MPQKSPIQCLKNRDFWGILGPLRATMPGLNCGLSPPLFEFPMCCQHRLPSVQDTWEMTEQNLSSLWQTQTTVACFHKPVCLFLSQYLATIIFLPSLEVTNVLCVSMPEMKSQDWFFCLRRIHSQNCEYLEIMIKNGLFWGMQAFFWCQ